SQQAVHFAAQAVMSGTQDLVIAGGVQSMNQIPIMAAMTAGEAYGHPNPRTGLKGWAERYGDEEISQFRGAELIARKWQISRRQMEEFALESNRRAMHAINAGYFEREIAPLGAFSKDETPRVGTTLDKMATLEPVVAGGSITAAVSSQIADGAAALLIASEAAVSRYNLEPRARIHHLSVRGDDPVLMLTAPIPATRRALDKA